MGDFKHEWPGRRKMGGSGPGRNLCTALYSPRISSDLLSELGPLP